MSKLFNRENSSELAPGLPSEGRARETMGFSNSGYNSDTSQLAAGRFIENTSNV